MLERLGRGAARHHWVVIGLWVLIAVGLGVGAGRSDGQTRDVFTIPGTQSQQAFDLLAERFPAANEATAQVVFVAPSGSTLTAPDATKAVMATVANLAKVPGAVGVTDPTTPTFAGDISPDGRIGYATVAFGQPVTELPADTLDKIRQATTPSVQAGLDVQYGGAVVDQFNQPTSAISDHADEIGILIAVVILLVSLGSFASMAVPISLALFALACSNLLLKILEAHVTIGSVAPVLGTMISLGVGIDYSLFIVSRHRQNLANGMPVDQAVGRSLATSGSAVLFAAITVCMALSGLALIRIPYVTTLGLSAALYVAVTVAAAMTLLPAMLGLLGHGVNAGRIRKHDERDPSTGLAARWARQVASRPVVFCLASLVVLLVVAAPLLKIQLGFTSDSSAPTDTTQRQAFDLLEQGFGPGANGPLLVAIALPDTLAGGSPEEATLAKLAAAIAAEAGVAKATPPIPDSAGNAAIISVTPTTGPTSPDTADLVRTLRSATIPTALVGGAIPVDDVSIGGATASFIDLTDLIEARLFPFILGVILGAFVLLMMVFRSLFVPAKAAVMNLLSIAAAYGFVVAVFQWGWGKGLIGLQEAVPIVAFVPVMMFAILFGLSMDYEVFLLSRIREDYQRSGDSHASVVSGLANTARVITSAALIMISVFLSFVTNPSPTVKMLGLGMAVAVFIDASIVRMMLVPATMELAGKWNWWIPSWLDRVLPHISVDAEPVSEPAPASP